MVFTSFNPANGEWIGSVKGDLPHDLQLKMDSSTKAFQQWKNSSTELRVDCLSTLAGLLELNQPSLALCITNEMGKVLKESEAEIEKSIEYFSSKEVPVLINLERVLLLSITINTFPF